VQLRARPPETSAFLHSDARFAGRVEEFLCQTKECLTRIVSQTWYKRSYHPTKFNASPTTTVGWLREWAVCAPARHKPPRGGASGERPESGALCFWRREMHKIDTFHTTHYNTHGLVPNRPPTKTFKPVLNLHCKAGRPGPGLATTDRCDFGCVEYGRT
jgi:hypothetical protein